jgi:hypothetical protein
MRDPIAGGLPKALLVVRSASYAILALKEEALAKTEPLKREIGVTSQQLTL